MIPFVIYQKKKNVNCLFTDKMRVPIIVVTCACPIASSEIVILVSRIASFSKLDITSSFITLILDWVKLKVK